jgi:hypothetical protein
MRIFVILAVFVVMSATAAAQNAAVGACAGATDVLDSATKASLPAKLDKKPRRQDNGIEPVAQNSRFQILNSTDEDRNTQSGAPAKWVVATGVVDTTGHIDPKTATIKQSSSVLLSHAVCDAWVKMAFTPATLHGQKVPAMYQERFVFQQSVVDASQNPNGNGGDRDSKH